MPKCYHSNGYNFIMVSERNGIYYYNITHSSGRHWDYNHPFTSVEEMDDYAHSHWNHDTIIFIALLEIRFMLWFFLCKFLNLNLKEKSFMRDKIRWK